MPVKINRKSKRQNDANVQLIALTYHSFAISGLPWVEETLMQYSFQCDTTNNAFAQPNQSLPNLIKLIL